MENRESVDLNAVSHKIQMAAFELFRYWTRDCGISDQLIIKDESVLVEDLRQAFCIAVIALYNVENLKHKIWGWDIGYILGCVEGNLGTHWHHEYIVKNSDAFKTLCGLRAVEGYLKFDKIAEIKVNKLYAYMLEENSNIANPHTEIGRVDIEDFLFHLTDLPEKGEILTLIYNLIMKQIKLVSEKKSDVSLPIEHYFTTSEIQQLIDDNKMSLMLH